MCNSHKIWRLTFSNVSWGWVRFSRRQPQGINSPEDTLQLSQSGREKLGRGMTIVAGQWIWAFSFLLNSISTWSNFTYGSEPTLYITLCNRACHFNIYSLLFGERASSIHPTFWSYIFLNLFTAVLQEDYSSLIRIHELDNFNTSVI